MRLGQAPDAGMSLAGVFGLRMLGLFLILPELENKNLYDRCRELPFYNKLLTGPFSNDATARLIQANQPGADKPWAWQQQSDAYDCGPGKWHQDWPPLLQPF
ncbi:MAG: MFS transporter [Synechococcaceae cyanobacterium RM1_1_27]|nr:MFS transporter [Synechococcaceae cyanobacterium RM1_1_27]